MAVVIVLVALAFNEVNVVSLSLSLVVNIVCAASVVRSSWLLQAIKPFPYPCFS
jgi:hypothetical protein